MFNDVDESLKAALTADIPIVGGEIDVAFDRPTREWSSRLSKPTLNLFLVDIRERGDLRDEQAIVNYLNDRSASKSRPARRIDLTYVVTAWAKEAADEHRILSRTMSSMFRIAKVAPDHLKGDLVHSNYPLAMRIMPPDYLVKPADLWGVMDNEARASLTWVATAPLEAFQPIEGPIVRTAEFAIGAVDQPWRESTLVIAGSVYRGSDPLDTIEGAEVVLEGTSFRHVTAGDGRFRFSRVVPGDYDIRATLADGGVHRRRVTVPGDGYDVVIPG